MFVAHYIFFIIVVVYLTSCFFVPLCFSEELEFTYHKSGGAGGQHVNKGQYLPSLTTGQWTLSKFSTTVNSSLEIYSISLTVSFIVSPAKHSGTKGSLCPAYVCLSVRLSVR